MDSMKKALMRHFVPLWLQRVNIHVVFLSNHVEQPYIYRLPDLQAGDPLLQPAPLHHAHSAPGAQNAPLPSFTQNFDF